MLLLYKLLLLTRSLSNRWPGGLLRSTFGLWKNTYSSLSLKFLIFWDSPSENTPPHLASGPVVRTHFLTWLLSSPSDEGGLSSQPSHALPSLQLPWLHLSILGSTSTLLILGCHSFYAASPELQRYWKQFASLRSVADTVVFHTSFFSEPPSLRPYSNLDHGSTATPMPLSSK